MSKFLNSIFLSLSTNIDNLSVGITFGTSREFGFDANLIIAVLSFVSTFVSMLLGAKIAPYVPQSSGALILFIIGMFMTYSAYYDTENNSNDSDLESSSTLKLKTKSRVSLKEAFILGLGLTFTNFGTGFGGGIAKLDVWTTSICSFISSLLTIGGGVYLGKQLSTIFNSRTTALISAKCLILYSFYLLMFPT